MCNFPSRVFLCSSLKTNASIITGKTILSEVPLMIVELVKLRLRSPYRQTCQRLAELSESCIFRGSYPPSGIHEKLWPRKHGNRAWFICRLVVNGDEIGDGFTPRVGVASHHSRTSCGWLSNNRCLLFEVRNRSLFIPTHSCHKK